MVEKISAISLSEEAPFSAPIPEGAREEHLILPGGSMDARWWVIHTEHMLREGNSRARETHVDGAPDGREVHWSSLLVWVLAALATILSLGSGKPAADFVAEAALYTGPVLLVALLLGLTAIVWKRYGRLEAAFYAVIFLTIYPILRTLQAGEADHHGPVIVFAAGSMLCLVCGGAGFVAKPGKRHRGSELLHADSAANWFRGAGLLGAAALWVSAATVIPVLVGTALGACAVAIFSRQVGNSTLRSELWATWGIAGCLGSVGFYILEYFPFQMGWRLEVNHPIYALAWLGGGFLLTQATAGIASGKMPVAHKWPTIIGSFVLVALPVGVIAFGRENVFWVSDRFLLALHKEYIFEFQSLPKLIAAYGNNWGWLTYYPWPVFAIIAGFVFIKFGNLSDAGKAALLLLAPPTLVMQALAIYQVRWGSAAFAMWSLCALVLFVESLRSTETSAKWIFRGAIATAWLAVAVTLVPQALALREEFQASTRPPIPREAGNGILLRDIAHRLIRSSVDKVPVVLTGPNSSTDLSYHGGIRTLGTLYWENTPGLKRAARIFAAPDEKTALALLTEAGVTHIVVPSWDNFVEAYSNLLVHEDGASSNPGFFKSILLEGNEPLWLRPFAYPIPGTSGLDADSVKIFAVLPEQNLFESHFYRGIYYLESNNLTKAREAFVAAEAIRPGEPRVRAFIESIDSRPQQEKEDSGPD